VTAKRNKISVAAGLGLTLISLSTLNRLKSFLKFRNLDYDTGGSIILVSDNKDLIIDGPNPLATAGNNPIPVRHISDSGVLAVVSHTRNSILGGGLRMSDVEVSIVKTEKSALDDAVQRKLNFFDTEKQAKVLKLREYIRGFLPSAEIYETFRTQARQDALYAQGREGIIVINALRKAANMAPISKDSPEANMKVTWTKVSEHTKMNAVDIVDRNLKGDWSWNTKANAILRRLDVEAIRSIGFKQPLKADDPWHFEFI